MGVAEEDEDRGTAEAEEEYVESGGALWVDGVELMEWIWCEVKLTSLVTEIETCEHFIDFVVSDLVADSRVNT